MQSIIIAQKQRRYMLHHFIHRVTHLPIPEQFTYPFHYTPHPLCIIAAEEVQAYIKTQKQWEQEIQQGKMFGVLVVQSSNDEISYLAAFSGNLAGKNRHPYFVPSIYDLLQPDGFFRIEEENISTLNIRIKQLQEAPYYLELKQNLIKEKALSQQTINHARIALKEGKETRELRRLNNPNEAEKVAMIRESQYQKAEFKRLEKYWKDRIAVVQKEIEDCDTKIEALRTERKMRSATLQQRLFEQFKMLNANGKEEDLCTIFKQTVQKIPPAGAGECAAPKLLQYAYLHQLKPVAMAEFWWGNSPKAEIRRHGYYYPACKGKCGPILKHMLQGLDVEPDPLSKNLHEKAELEVLFEDEQLLVINKPASMLSVPGKGEMDSVYQRLKTQYADATGPMIVHRLDMATSGVLLVAKTKETHQNLQAQFKNRTVRKRYIALLDGLIPQNEGIINLPLCPDPLDRPRQIVNEKYGKTAVTRYQVLERNDSQTRIYFYPLTGRTHQLRVHAAHPFGLNCPITGDELYGKRASRLYLHAEFLEFVHPASGEIISIEAKADF